MALTTEVRWFYHGPITPSIQNWFQQDPLGRNITPLESRSDRYLPIPGLEAVNLKLRQGHLELKLRQAELPKLTTAAGWSGKPEQWLKWQVGSPILKAVIAPQILRKGPWLRVDKRRSQRFYTLSAAHEVEPVQRGRRVSCGCGVEITELKVQKAAWWSLGLEAFGEAAQQGDMLQAIAQWISDRAPDDLCPQGTDSFGYPHWLLYELASDAQELGV